MLSLPTCLSGLFPRSRPQRLILALGVALITGNWLGAFVPLFRPSLATSIATFTLFTIAAGGVTWLVAQSMREQQTTTHALVVSEEKIKEQNALLQSTLENMGEGLSVFDYSGRLIAWNARFLELLELPSGLAETANLQKILSFQAARGDFGPIDPTAHVEERIEWFYSQVPAVRERMTPSGHTLQIRRNAMPGGIVSLYSDITDRKAAQEKMEHAWAQAELANRSKGEFLANMSHELRTPLNAIIGFSEIIGAEHLGPMHNPRYLEYCRDIHASGLLLLSIINDVLDMSKIEAGKLEVHEEELFVSPLLAECARIMRDRAEKQEVDLVCELPYTEIALYADERALKQALLNLVSNAIKFSPNGGRVVLSAALAPDSSVVLSVRDQGIGMSPSDLDRALQPFGQANSSTTRTFGGTGLGLPITKGLIEAHGGALEIETAPGVGTLVRIILPPDRTRLFEIARSEPARLRA